MENDPQTRGRGRQVTRQLRLLRLLQSRRGGLRVEEIVRETKVLRRTVYRDLEQLQAAGYPLVSVAEEGERRWRLEEGFRARVVTPGSALESAVMKGAVEALGPLHGSSVGEAARTVTGQLCAGGDDAALLSFPRPGPTRQDPSLVDRLTAAVLGHERLQLVYRAQGQRPRRRCVEPLRLFLAQGLVYLAADDCTRAETRCYRLDRIVSVEATGERFPARAFDLAAWLGDAVGVFRGASAEVRLRSRLEARELAASIGVAAERVTLVDGELRLDAAITPELRARLLALGAQVEVLAPADLRRAVAAELGHAAKLYAA